MYTFQSSKKNIHGYRSLDFFIIIISPTYFALMIGKYFFSVSLELNIVDSTILLFDIRFLGSE